MTADQWSTVLSRLGTGNNISTYQLFVGFSSAWLAFSGLESISQLSPSMRLPLRRTTRWAMAAVIVTMVVTSPVLTALSIGLLPEHFKAAESERFISELGRITGGLGVKLAVVFTASSLLLFAANTAIIGSYHVFLALVNSEFLPKIISLRSKTFNTPHIAIGIATVVPALVILASAGRHENIGRHVCVWIIGSLRVLVVKLGRRFAGTWVGATWAFGSAFLPPSMVMVAWGVNLVEKQLATVFGGGVTLIGMLIAVGVRRSWFVDALTKIPLIQRLQARAYRASEGLVEDELRGLVTLAEAVEVKALYPSTTLLAIRDESPRLIQEGITRAKGKGELAIYCIYVEEWPGLFAGNTPHAPNEEGVKTLRATLQAVREKNIEIIPIWTVAHNAADAIANAAKALDVDTVFIGASRRSAFYHMLRGHVIKGLMKKLPRDCHLMICN